VFAAATSFAFLFAAGVAYADGTEVYSPRPIDEVRSQVLQWMSRHNITDKNTVSRIEKLWTPSAAPQSGREAFDRLIETFCLGDPAAKKFVESCAPWAGLKPTPHPELLMRGEDEFCLLHLGLYVARSLTQRMLYDEALDVFKTIDAARVIDPATCLFYEAVCQHQLLMKTEGLKTLDQLLDKTQGVSESYAKVGALMRDELRALDERSLGSASRKMKDSERRLDLGRGGQRVQKVQAEIVETLDEIIKKAEQQANSPPPSGDSESHSNRSNSPAEDSRTGGATGPGNVDKKNLKKQGAWGSLPAKDETRALNLLSRDFPSNYRQAVEEYFKKLAKRSGGKGQ
jgi:hypothetical protein